MSHWNAAYYILKLLILMQNILYRFSVVVCSSITTQTSLHLYTCLSELKATRLKEPLQTGLNGPWGYSRNAVGVLSRAALVQSLLLKGTLQSWLSLRPVFDLSPSGCSRRGTRPTLVKWWRSCSKSSMMRCFTWTPALSAAGAALWWGTLGTWRGPITGGSLTPVISS